MPPLIFIIMAGMEAFLASNVGQAAATAGQSFFDKAIDFGLGAISSRKSYKRQKRLMMLQNQFNIDQWNRENEYNLPSNVRKRLEDAGINPYTAMSNAQSSPVSSISGVGLGSAPSPQTSFGGQSHSIADTLMNARMIASNIEVNEAQKQKILADRDKSIAEKNEIISKTPTQKNTGDVQNAFTISQTPTEKNTGDVQNEYTTALTEGQRISNVLNSAKIQFADETARQEFELLTYNVINAMLDGDMKRAAAKKMLAEALLANANAKGQKISNYIAEVTANNLIERTNTEHLYWKRQAELGAAQGATKVNLGVYLGDKYSQAAGDRLDELDRKNGNGKYAKSAPKRYYVPRTPLKTINDAVRDFKRRNPNTRMDYYEIRDWLEKYYYSKGKYKTTSFGTKYVWNTHFFK